MKEIIVSDFSGERYIAIKENGLSNFFYETKPSENLVGNIYLGIVRDIVPGIQAAFIDIGQYKNVFLHQSDLLAGSKDAKIEDILKLGQQILIQIKKEPSGDKSAKVSDQISIAGNYLILTNEAGEVGVSKKISHNRERSRLKGIAAGLIPADKGVIVRTRAEKKSKEKLAIEANYLLSCWQDIEKDLATKQAPALLYENESVLERVCKKEAGKRLSKVVVDTKSTYDLLSKKAEIFSPNLIDKLEYYRASRPIFAQYELEKDILGSLNKKVRLSSGGYIIFDQTEALTVVDVNTGKSTTGGSFADVIYNTNYEAARAVIRELKIRNIGGIIIIDFIDMKRKKDQQKLIKILKKELAKDSKKSSVLGMTKLGLVELTREQQGKTLKQLLQKRCNCCDGEGRVLVESLQLTVKSN